MAKIIAPQRSLYSRYVSVVKVLLPLIAIALLATVFLFTSERTIDGGFEFSKADLVSLEAGLLVSKPRFSGSTAGGDEYNFIAEYLRPDAPKPTIVQAEGISGEIHYLQGTTVQISAQEAVVGLEDRTVRLSEGVSVVFSDGFRASSDNLFAELNESRLTTNGPVTALSLMGNISAGNLRVETVLRDGEENQMIWFEKGVKLVINLDSDNGVGGQ